MIVVCPNCTTRLQLEDAKIPSRPFTMRCPKCQQIINAQPPATNGAGGALAAGNDLPTSTRTQREVKSMPAPAFNLETKVGEPDKPEQTMPNGEGDLARLLAALLQRSPVGERQSSPGMLRRPSWDRRRGLVCVGAEPQREVVARGLANSHYEVFVAMDTMQAIERMREDKMDVVVLDTQFDAIEQGAAFINREITALRPAERRRVVFVNLSPTVRTADTHAAFLSNVNLLVNNEDAEQLPYLLERCISAMNDLYRDFNKALNVTEL